ncbi:hypothetical protein [Lutibacter sp.]|uniref:hypothetical protein n=1 Tax=Lutibacter sp. TaxID=1925666 RepID=UPI002732B8AB|nr:hypothetical protein [Lutibacter sp.]MDP3312959.1 hypothetical protein [Lutibacter sp.]
MESSLLKCVFIASKKYKISLLISHNEASTLCNFIESTINTNVLVLNTNIGLEIYYNSTIDYTILIANSFLLITAKQGKEAKEYRIVSFSTFPDLKDGIQQMLVRFSSMPLALKCYLENLFYQLDINYKKNNQLISILFSIWEQILNSLVSNNLNDTNFNQFKKSIIKFNIKNSSNHILKELITNAISSLQQN